MYRLKNVYILFISKLKNPRKTILAYFYLFIISYSCIVTLDKTMS